VRDVPEQVGVEEDDQVAGVAASDFHSASPLPGRLP
jgi:hypothetical protein